MHVKGHKDFVAGLIFAVIGVAFAWGSTHYTIGDGASMGPGYFPLLLGIVLAIIGAIMMFQSLVLETADGDPIGKWAWRPLCCIGAANLLFGALLDGIPSLGLPAMGLVAAICALVVVSALASKKFRWLETLVVAALLAAGSWLTLVWWLKLSVQVWPGSMTG
ncbi:MAG: tripartite tricarboxylate transporter TctB family protein [Burkholderiaceae bacterium]|nr:tripartite tricarboxylate transporter TctB family protein [Burkholderiaceae bacterium]